MCDAKVVESVVPAEQMKSTLRSALTMTAGVYVE